MRHDKLPTSRPDSYNIVDNLIPEQKSVTKHHETEPNDKMQSDRLKIDNINMKNNLNALQSVIQQEEQDIANMYLHLDATSGNLQLNRKPGYQ